MTRCVLNCPGGLLFVAIGAAFFIQPTRLPIGTLQHFGPGMFPFLVSLLLMFGGAVLAVTDLRAAQPEPTGGPVYLKSAMLLLSYLVFAVSIASGGLAIAIPSAWALSYWT